jgi:hypothetical protein
MLSRSYLPALLLGLALGWITLPRPEASADETSDRIERLVKQLGASKYADRERAQRELRAVGTPALDALKKASRDDGELGRRARALVVELEQKAAVERALAPKKVRLTFKDTPVIDAVDELVRQSGHNIQIQGEVKDLAKRKVTFDTGETTFWQAFDRLCAEAGLVEVNAPAAAGNRFPAAAGLNRNQFQFRPMQVQPFPMPRRPGRLNNPLVPGAPGMGRNDDEQIKQLQKMLEQQLDQMMREAEQRIMQHVKQGRMSPEEQQMLRQMLQQFKQLRQLGPMQLRPGGFGGGLARGFNPAPDPVEQEIRPLHVKDGKPQKVPTAYAGALRIRLLPTERDRRDEASLVMDLSVEPSVPGFAVADGARLTRATDERGQDVNATLVNRLQAVRGVRGVMSVPEPVVHVRLGDKEVKQLKELRGRLKGQALTRTDPLIVVTDIFNAVGKTFKGADGGSIEILAVEKKGDGEVQVQLRLESPPPRGGDVRAASLPELLDAKGESYQLVQVPSRGRRSNGRVVTQELTMHFRANPGQGDPSRLVLNGVRSVAVEVPFQFENVSLPEVRSR